MSPPTAWRIVAASAVGDPARLVALAESIFGVRDRPAGWFARKLARECVDASRSALAIDADADATDPQGWLGYVLLGMPPSRHPAARTAGTGVVSRARGLGIGTALLDRATAWASDAGCDGVELLADPDAETFYTRCGFSVVRPLASLVFPARGTATHPSPIHPSPAQAWDTLLGPGLACVSQWLAEAWERTDPALRHTVQRDALGVHVSEEGRAWLVHRLVAPTTATAATVARTLPDVLPAGRPIVMPLLTEVSPITDAFIAAGWHPIQRGTLLRWQRTPR